MTSGVDTAREWRLSIIALIPSLRAFGLSLSRNASDADDLVQETLIKALSNRDRFSEGTNLRAWLFTILRNTFYTSALRRRRETSDPDGLFAASLSSGPSQDWSAELGSLQDALNELPAEHREALILVGAMGLTYEEAAEICHCALGTIKSRVNRARVRVAKMLDHEELRPRHVTSKPTSDS